MEHGEIYLVKVDTVKENEKKQLKYPSIDSVKATVVKTFKGQLKAKDNFTAHVYNIEGLGAVCPIFLNEGKQYLLFMNQINGQMLIQRQGARYLEQSHPHYNNYLLELEKGIKK